MTRFLFLITFILSVQSLQSQEDKAQQANKSINSSFVLTLLADQQINGGVINICQGETVVFTGVTAYPELNQSDETSYFYWNFVGLDEVGSFNLPEVSQTFSSQEDVPLILEVTDNLGNVCTAYVLIRVSNAPNFDALASQFEESICLGNTNTYTTYVDPVDGTGYGVSSNTVNTTLQVVNSVPMQIPDGMGGVNVFFPEYYHSSIIINEFDDDAVVESVDQINSICMDINHRYASDLEAWIICPSLDTLLLYDGYYNQGQNEGTFLGGVSFGSSSLGNPDGVGYSYCFTSDSENSFEIFADMNILIPEGDYLPMGTMENLIGCPLNGQWKLMIGDYFLEDEGTVFEWGINLSGNFTPLLIEGSWISDPAISEVNDSTIEITPTNIGYQHFIYEVTDEFNCTYEQDFTLLVLTEDCLVGVEELEGDYSLDIFPNPSSSMVNISLPNGYMQSLTIFNVLGELVFSKTGVSKNTFQWDVLHLKNGTYTITVIDQNGNSISRKLLKMN